ncbi:hypothetical protein G9C98_004087 [Cotesia typhae]|uniref:Uncharacterized protein n=1 Tax=Cotesia typhae TaxID=2053667 RepID=A0A8J5UU87_9HYME|nr:hypothetical protein G9C98_004087 [Cotesia typhae]
MESEENKKIKEKCLLRVLDELGEGSKLLWMVFTASILAPLINGMHSMFYVFISEWELVCDKYLYRGNTFSAFALGRLLGNGFLGIYVDKNGRKKH